jgi:hypothetical protein
MSSWRNEKQTSAVGVIEAFLESEMQMAEVDLARLPEPERKGSGSPSRKQDSFASSFYAWKRKASTKEKLKQKGIDIRLIRQGEKVALKKKAR